MSHPWPIDRNRRREIDEGNQTQRELDRDEVTFPFQFGDKLFVTVFLLSLAYKAKLTHTPRHACRANLSTKCIFLSTPTLLGIRLLHGCDNEGTRPVERSRWLNDLNVGNEKAPVEGLEDSR